MRNPKRLDKFYFEKCRLHKKYLPDWRVGQFDVNFYGWLSAVKQIDPFFPEEDRMIDYLKEYIEECVGDRFDD